MVKRADFPILLASIDSAPLTRYRRNNMSVRSYNFQEQSERLNLLRFVSRLLGCDFGSLWWVRDSLWKSTVASFRESSQRGGGEHPGVCCRETEPASPFDAFPLLFGTSGEVGPVVARGLSPGSPPDSPTSFGVLLAPTLLESRDFFQIEGDQESGNARRNRHKPRFDEKETDGLLRHLERIVEEGGSDV